MAKKISDEELSKVIGGNNVVTVSSNDTGTAWCPYDNSVLKYWGMGYYDNLDMFACWSYSCPKCGKKFYKLKLFNCWMEEN